MIKNKLRQSWDAGKPTLNGWLSIGNSFSAEIMAEQGYDSICIDLQPWVRTPWLEPGIIMKALDAGAYGIICPMIDTPEKAAEFVSYVRYPPAGTRSFGPTRVNFAVGGNYAREANDEILAFAMVESAEAMSNLEAIAATPGLDGIYVGPADLTFSLSNGQLAPAFDREEPEMIEAIKEIATACKSAGIRSALHCGTPGYASRAIDWGFNMTTVSNDVRLLASAAAADVQRFRELTAGKGDA